MTRLSWVRVQYDTPCQEARWLLRRSCRLPTTRWQVQPARGSHRGSLGARCSPWYSPERARDSLGAKPTSDLRSGGSSPHALCVCSAAQRSYLPISVCERLCLLSIAWYSSGVSKAPPHVGAPGTRCAFLGGKAGRTAILSQEVQPQGYSLSSDVSQTSRPCVTLDE